VSYHGDCPMRTEGTYFPSVGDGRSRTDGDENWDRLIGGVRAVEAEVTVDQLRPTVCLVRNA
jgi:hypothetical protein